MRRWHCGGPAGRFEIRIDDRITSSKKALGRFPTDAEIIGLVT